MQCSTRILIRQFRKVWTHCMRRSCNRMVWKGPRFTSWNTHRNPGRLEVLKFVSLYNKIRSYFLYSFFSLK